MSKHLQTGMDWPTLREWCLAHGAKNDSITVIQIDGFKDKWNVILEGNERDVDGRPLLQNRHGEVARWRSVQPLRFLP